VTGTGVKVFHEVAELLCWYHLACWVFLQRHFQFMSH